MKTIVWLASLLGCFGFFFFTRAVNAGGVPISPVAIYLCTFVQSTATNQVQVHLFTDRTCLIGGPGIGVQYGTWNEKRLVRTFSILNSSNQFVGTIRKGVVRGAFLNYRTGETGAIDAEP